MSTQFLVVTRREVQETITDWRILMPMLTLALLFPGILVAGINVGMPYLDQIDPRLATEKASVFGATMAAFFPISFSLIIALESFAGEKERNTLEALLATPISDAQMFLGKFLAVLAPPAFLSLVGLSVFTIGLRLGLDIEVPPDFLLLAILLGFVEALAMVAAAVVVSSQAPSVKAANLLASFIIIPVALVVQGEVMLLLTGYGHVLWFILAAFVVISAMLVRMGIQLFNREEILARENDNFDLRAVFGFIRRAWGQLPGDPPYSPLPQPEVDEMDPLPQGEGRVRVSRWPTLGRLYARDFPNLLRSYRGPLLLVFGAVVTGGFIGYGTALQNPLSLPALTMAQPADPAAMTGMQDSISVTGIFFHNLRTVLIAGVLSLFTFGAAGLLMAVLSSAAVGFLAGQAGIAGADVPTFLFALVAPHGVLEVPAIILASALNVWLGMCLMTIPKDRTLGQGLMVAMVNWVKGAAVFIPLLLLAAVVEAKITPLVAMTVYGP